MAALLRSIFRQRWLSSAAGRAAACGVIFATVLFRYPAAPKVPPAPVKPATWLSCPRVLLPNRADVPGRRMLLPACAAFWYFAALLAGLSTKRGVRPTKYDGAFLTHPHPSTVGRMMSMRPTGRIPFGPGTLRIVGTARHGFGRSAREMPSCCAAPLYSALQYFTVCSSFFPNLSLREPKNGSKNSDKTLSIAMTPPATASLM